MEELLWGSDRVHMQHVVAAGATLCTARCGRRRAAARCAAAATPFPVIQGGVAPPLPRAADTDDADADAVSAAVVAAAIANAGNAVSPPDRLSASRSRSLPVELAATRACGVAPDARSGMAALLLLLEDTASEAKLVAQRRLAPPAAVSGLLRLEVALPHTTDALAWLRSLPAQARVGVPTPQKERSQPYFPFPF